MTKQAMIELFVNEKYSEKLIAPMLDAALIALRIVDYEEIPDNMVEAVKKEMNQTKQLLETLTVQL